MNATARYGYGQGLSTLTKLGAAITRTAAQMIVERLSAVP
jgi:hypothetical protein